MMHKLCLALLLLFATCTLRAGKYFWVNGSGNWTDLNHWATTSGGAVMHSVLPGISDTVYFDASSFAADGRVVSLDTNRAFCAMMDWTGTAYSVEFNSLSSDTLTIAGSLILAEKLTFNHRGLLLLAGPAPVISRLETFGKTFRCDMELAADSLYLAGELSIPSNRLLHTNGSFYANGYRISCRHFNTQSSLMAAVPVIAPVWYSADSLTIGGSFAKPNAMTFHQSGPVYFQNSTLDTNYINLYAGIMPCDVFFTGSKKMYLLSQFSNTEKIEFKGSGRFYSNNHAINTNSFVNGSSLQKYLYLGTSAVNISGAENALYLPDTRLFLDAANTTFHFTYTGADTVSFYAGHDSLYHFGSVHFSEATVNMYSSMSTGDLILDAGCRLAMAHGVDITLDNLTADGTCGNYIYLSSFCAECPSCGNLSDCPSDMPRFISTGAAINASYLKIAWCEALGATFTAANSFALDTTSGWVINEPATSGNMYWVNGSGSWNDPSHWSNSSGGASGTCIPSRGNNVVFDVNSFADQDTVSIDEFAFCKSMLWQNPSHQGMLSGHGLLFVADSLQLDDSTVIDIDNGVELHATAPGVHYLIPENADIRSDITINTTGSYALSDTLETQAGIFLEKGTFNLNRKSLTCRFLQLEATAIRRLDYEHATITLTGSDTVWNAGGSNLTLVSDSGSISIAYPGNEAVMLKTEGRAYDTLHIHAPLTRIIGGGTSDMFSVSNGVNVEFEPLSTWTSDSLTTAGGCVLPVVLSSFAGSSDTATFIKSGFDTLQISGVILRNIVADTNSGKRYFANSSTGIGITHGWNITGSTAGQTYFWTGLSDSFWHNPLNWTSTPATGCVPGPADTVVFDDAHFAAAINDSVLVTHAAFCRVMDWSGIGTSAPSLLIQSDLSISGDITLNDSLTLQYSGGFSPNDADPPVLLLAPDSGKTLFNPSAKYFGINLRVAGHRLSDTLMLTDTLVTDSTVSLAIYSGTFDTESNAVSAGIFRTSTDALKSITLNHSAITVKYILDFQSAPELTLSADSSYFLMPGNQSFTSYFNGGGHQYFDLVMQVLSSDSATAVYRGEINGSNHFRIFRTEPGMNLMIEQGTTQTIDSLFDAIGTCADSIYIYSPKSSVPVTLNCLATDSIRTQCTVLKGIIAPNGGQAVFSRDAGFNSGWSFIIDKATYASFTLPPTTCFGDTIHFTNTSTAFSGNQADLTFDWDFGDDSLSTLVHPDHLYALDRDFVVTLTSTFINGCQDVFVDTISIYNPTISISSSESDTTLCAGDTVTITATSPNASPLYSFVSNGLPVIQSPDSIRYITDSITDGETIFAIVSYMGCLDTSNIFVFNVNPLPLVQLSCDDADQIICDGDSVQLSALGATQYSLHLNGTEYSILSTQNTWDTDTINDADVFTLFGRNTTTGCEAWSSDTLDFTVNPLPTVSITTSDPDTTICQGESATVYASGTDFYIFYLNGTAMGAPSATDSMVFTGLNDHDIITVEGISASGCRSMSLGGIEFNVNVTPNVSFISSDADGRICSGESVTLQAGGATQYQFLIDGVPTGAFDFNNSLTDAFTHGQAVSVQGVIGNCYAWADTVFTFDVRPSITWTYSTDEICAGDTIFFEAEGDTVYQYFIDGIAATPLQYDSLYAATGLTDGQSISVSGTALACTPQAIVVTVHPVPLIHATCSESDAAICNGDNISFQINGSQEYGFYVNGGLQSGYSTVNTYSTTTLANGDLVTFQALSAFGCRSFSADSFTVEVAPYPVVHLTCSDIDQVICAGDTVSFTASGANNYEFFVSGASQGIASPTTLFETGSLLNGADVSVHGTSGYCTSVSVDVYHFTVNAIPQISFNPVSGLSVCEGDTIRLLAGGATSYQFYVDGLPWGSLSGNSLFVSDTMTSGENVTVEGYLLGCKGIADSSYTVTVNQYPNLAFTNNQPSGELCFGDSVIFNGTGAQHYSFYLNGIPVSSDSVFVTTSLEQGQNVTLYGYNGVCGVWADTVMSLTVNYVDVSLVSDQATNTVCSGASPVFTASGADLYEFFLNGVSQGAPSSNNEYSPSALSNGQVVSVSGTSLSSGCTQDAFSEIYFHVMDVPAVTATPDSTFCEGDSVLLSSSVNGWLQWTLDGSPLVNATNETLWVLEGGTYAVSQTQGGTHLVLSCGDNSEGQLGDGSGLNQLMFETTSTTNVTAVACGTNFTLALHSDGTVSAWGDNEFGALGNGNFTDSDLPVQSGSMNTIISVAAGNRFGLALRDDSTVMAWGENTFGQLGYGNYSSSNFPFPVNNLDSVVAIAAGGNHSLALTSDGSVYAWGKNHFGQLGDSTLINKNTAVKVKQLPPAKAIAAGENHSMAIGVDGSLWIWGSNVDGQLGTGNYNGALVAVKVNLFNSIASCDGGFAHTIVADSSGHVLCWGDNSYQQLGTTSVMQSLYPVDAGISGALQVKAGPYASYVLRADSNLISFGQNNAGQLGLEISSTSSLPTVIDQAFSVQSFDAGSQHLAVVQTQESSCISSGVLIIMDTVPFIDLNVSGTTLSTSVSGVSYQWFYNGSAIPGANSQSLAMAAWGEYYVEVTFTNGCTGISEVFTYGVGMDEFNTAEMLIFPNPSNGDFTVMISGNTFPERMVITDMLGNETICINVEGQAFPIAVSGLNILPGVYHIQVYCSGGVVKHGRITIVE